MKFVTIPGTTLNVSQICLGTSEFGARLNLQQAVELLNDFVAQGGNFIDTAHVYADWIPGTKSSSEKMIGQWWRSAGLSREQIVLATKGAHPELATMHISRMSRADIARDVDESLEYLRTDYIDLYWLHRDDPAIPVGSIIDVLNEQVAAGKIAYFGGSNWTVARLQEANDYAASNHLQGFVANQPMWSLAVPNMDAIPDKTVHELDAAGLAYHKRTGLAVVPYTSQAKGFFTKMASGNDAVKAGADQRLYGSATNNRRLAVVQDLARKHAVTVGEVALAYLLCQPFTTIPIVGPKNIDQLRESLKALDLRLTPQEIASLEVV